MKIYDGSRRHRLAAASLLVALPVIGVSSLCMPTSARQGLTGAYKQVRAALGLPGGPSQRRQLVITSSTKPLPRYKYSQSLLQPVHHNRLKSHAGISTVSIDEPVQTFDMLRPPPDFVPIDTPQNTVNLTPSITPDEQWIVFSSNRQDPNGHFHIWVAPIRGGTPIQLTNSASDGGDDLYPVIGPNGDKIAFVSDAASPGQHNLYVIPFNTQLLGAGLVPVNVDRQTSLTLRSDIATGFTDVGRPAWSPSEDQIAFSALTNEGTADDGLYHIYYLYTASRGYLASAGAGTPNPPGKVTAGPENDTDVAWSANGSYIAFASSADSFTNTGQGAFPDPTSPAQETTPVVASGTQPLVGSVQPTSIFMLTSSGTVPNIPGADLTSTGGRITTTGNVDGGPAWAPNNNSGAAGFIAFSRAKTTTLNAPSQIYYFQADNGGVPQTEPAGGAHQLLTDNPNVTAATPIPTAVYRDLYPSWPGFANGVAIAYQSNRTITYNDPATGAPSETAISIKPGTFGLGANYVGILESEVQYINPPTLLRYSDATGEIIHISQSGGTSSPSQRQIVPGTPVTFTVRLSNREAGIDNTGGPADPNSGVPGPNVFIQIKDPDSKYQDSQQLEHKLFTDRTSPLYNGHRGDLLMDLGGLGVYQQPGMIGGVSPENYLVSIGHVDAPYNTSDYTNHKGNFTHKVTGADGKQYHLNGFDPGVFQVTGQEYECQYVNPYYNVAGATDTTPADYGTPVYLPGFDDQLVYSAPNTAGGAPAGWLQLTKAQQQDTNGGVLYTATWTTPISPSDYYLDVIAFDNAKKAIANSAGNNWRIYDNVWGFTTQKFSGGNSILVVSDNALGQKYAASVYGRQGTLGAQNLRPTYYGAESYYTGIDVALLPNAVTYIQPGLGGLVYPNFDPPITTGTAPTNLTLYPYINEVWLSWQGIPSVAATPLLGYNVYRSTNAANVVAPGNLIKFTTATNYDDIGTFRTAPSNGTTYYYAVTAVTQGTTGPTESASVTANVNPPGFVGTGNAQQVVLALGDMFGSLPWSHNRTRFGVENTLGKGAFDEATTAYDLWRTLARGPINETTLLGYAGTKVTQPAIAAPTPPGGPNEPAADFIAAPKCVVWITPYTGDLFVGPGSFADPDTQTAVTNFINRGGRICVSGQDVASTITGNGTAGPNTFLPQVMGANYTSSTGGVQTLAIAGAGDHRLTNIGAFNTAGAGGYPEYGVWNPDLNSSYSYIPPKNNPLIISSDVGATVLQPGDVGPLGGNTWRTDGALTEPIETGINAFYYGSIYSTSKAFIDTVAPVNGAVPDITFGGTDTGLQYLANPTTGGRVVFGSFGLEGLGTEYYAKTYGNLDYYFPYNQRQHVLNNIVTFMRSGSVTGTVTVSNGKGGSLAVPGATVYVQPTIGSTVPYMPAGRTAYSGITNSSGVYRIDALEAGDYVVSAYKNGLVPTVSHTYFSARSQTVPTVNLVMGKLTDGTFSGNVSYPAVGGNPAVPVAGATVTFKSTDGLYTVTGVTDDAGNYSINAVPAAASPGEQYTGVATFGLGTSASATALVLTAQNTVVNFTLAGSNQFTGRVVITGTQTGISGATVTFTEDGGGTPVTATTATNGTYTSPILQPGTYTITAALTGTYLPTTLTGVVLGDSPRPTPLPNIGLSKLMPGVVTGVVSFADGTGFAQGATVTIVSADGKTTLSATTNNHGAYKISNVPSFEPPGAAYTGTASLGGVTSAPAAINMLSGGFVTVNYSLAPVPGKFFGTVSDAVTNALLSGATITVTDSTNAVVDTQTTDAAGAYTTAKLPPGNYKITASFAPAYLPTYVTQQLKDNGNQNTSFKLVPVGPAQISGVVYFKDGKTPAVGAVVTYTGTTAGGANVTVSATADASGKYLITGVPAEAGGLSYTGSASLRSLSSPTATVSAMSNSKLVQNFTLPTIPGDIKGTVTAAGTGALLKGVTVTISDGTNTPQSVVTGADGTYQFLNVAPGKYTITATFEPRYLPTTSTLTLTDNQTATRNITLALKPAATIGGLVTIGSMGKLAANATIEITDSTGTFDKTVTAASSTSTANAPAGDTQPVNYAVTVPDPGTYTVTITVPGFAPIVKGPFTVALNKFYREDGNIPAVATLSAGIHMFSLPYDYTGSSWASLFQGNNPKPVQGYDPLSLSYVPNPAIELGRGYWVNLSKDTDIIVPPTPIVTTSVSVPLHPYWNLIGTPSTSPIPVANLKFTLKNGTILNFVNATSTSSGARVIDPTLYGYDQSTNSYKAITGTGSLQPWQGYWIKAYQDVTVTIPTGAASGASRRK